MPRRRLIGAGAFVAGLGSNALSPAFAQTSVPTKFIVPGSAGTGADTIARYMARMVEKQVQIPVVVDNKPGAGGVIGTDAVAKSAPDGTTLLITSANHYVLPWIYDKLPYKALEDFTPVAGFGTSTLLMVVAPDAPYSSLRDIIASAKGANAQLSYSSAGNGTLSHICGALLNVMAGIDLKHVAYKSASQGLLDVSTGVVTVGFLGIVGAMPLVNAGKLKAIAVTGKSRSTHFSGVPAIDESGLKGYDIDSPFMALAPRHVSAKFTEKLEKAFIAATHDPSYREFCAMQGFESEFRQSAAQMTLSMPQELAKWKMLAALAQAKAS